MSRGHYCFYNSKGDWYIMIIGVKNTQYIDKDLHIKKITYNEYHITSPQIFIGTYQIIQIVNGYIECFDLTENKVFKYSRGSMCILPTNTRYVLKIKQESTIIKILLSGTCEKIDYLNPTKEYITWISRGIPPYRKDYFHDNSAPLPNSIRPAASAIIVNNKNQLLLLQRRDNQKWAIPGGTLEYTESIEECLLREVKEETGLNVKILKVFKIYSDPEAIIEYLDGEIRREFNIVFLVKPILDEVIIDDESCQYAWIDINKVHLMPLSSSQKRRILDIQKLLQASGE